jgi:ATP adenylyltransferase
MEHLWAPWRNSYVNSDKKTSDDIFYQIGQSANDEENLVVYRSKSCFVLLNRFPYNSGHSLVLPYRAVADLNQLSADESTDLWQTTTLTVNALKKSFSPQGFNIGVNLGSCAGAGIPNHLHVHIVPRWNGDANFMTATAETRIHPSELTTVYAQMKSAFAAE